MRRRSRRRADWVYRSFLWEDVDPTTQEPFLSGTYYNPIQLTSGQPGASALILVDSHNYGARRIAIGQDAGGGFLGFGIGAPALPESRQAGLLILGVDVNVHLWQASTSWFGTAVIHLGLRIIVAKQDSETGAVLQHPDYSMWQNVGSTQASGPDYWANGRQNCWDFRHSWTPKTQATNANPLATWIRARPRFKRRLQVDECLALWIEGHQSNNPQGIDLINPFCRTLVQQPD